MNDKEALDILKNNAPKTCKMVNGRYQGGFDDWDCDLGKAIKLAISALEERDRRETAFERELREIGR